MIPLAKVIREIHNDGLKLLEQGGVAFFDHEIRGLIQEGDDVFVDLFAGSFTLHFLTHHADEIFERGILGIFGVFAEGDDEGFFAGYGDVTREFTLLGLEFIPFPGFDPLCHGDGTATDQIR